MILGIGSDMVEINRIRRLIEQFGDKFIQRVFTAREIEYAQKQNRPEAAFAKRFCAKEAALKALGTGFSRSISWSDVEVTNQESGQPHLTFSGNAFSILQDRKQELFGEQGFARTFLSLTDTEELASAMVVIEIAGGECM